MLHLFVGVVEEPTAAAARDPRKDGVVGRLRGGGRGVPFHDLCTLVPGSRLRSGGAAETPGRPWERGASFFSPENVLGSYIR